MEDDTMSKQTVRIENISIENLKNVKYGYLNFENKKKNYKASILGLKASPIFLWKRKPISLSGRSRRSSF